MWSRQKKRLRSGEAAKIELILYNFDSCVASYFGLLVAHLRIGGIGIMYIIEHDYACACCPESFGHGSQIRKVLIRPVHQYEEDRVRLPS